jgi:hypothetical protein
VDEFVFPWWMFMGVFDIKPDVAHDILEDPKAWNYHKVRNFRIGKKGL